MTPLETFSFEDLPSLKKLRSQGFLISVSCSKKGYLKDPSTLCAFLHLQKEELKTPLNLLSYLAPKHHSKIIALLEKEEKSVHKEELFFLHESPEFPRYHSHSVVLFSLSPKDKELFIFPSKEKEPMRNSTMSQVGLLAAGISHDINNLLSPLFLDLHTLEKASFTQEQQNCFLRFKDVLFLLKERAHHLSLSIKELGNSSATSSLAKSLGKVQQLTKLLLPPNISFDSSLSIPPEDRVALKQSDCFILFLNLIQNAKEAIGEKTGSIFLSARKEKGLIIVELKDSGSGIAKEVQKCVFEPFFSTKDKEKNSGIGLAQCKQIIDSLGGSIEILPSNPQGTLFVLRLPLLKKSL